MLHTCFISYTSTTLTILNANFKCQPCARWSLASLRVQVPRSEWMKEYGNIGNQSESRSQKGAEARLSQPPNTESWSLCGGNDPKVGNRNGTTNRTIIKFKRRQGTHSGRKESVAPHLKQISLDTFTTASGDDVSVSESFRPRPLPLPRPPGVI